MFEYEKWLVLSEVIARFHVKVNILFLKSYGKLIES